MGKNNARYMRIIFCMAVILAAAVFLCACNKDQEQITLLSQLDEEGSIIAVSTNTPEASRVMDDFPNAKIESYSDIYPSYQEVANGKITACIYQRTQMQLAVDKAVRGVRLLDENYCENVVGIGISRESKIPDLRGKINKFLTEVRDDGTLDEMNERWVLKDDETMPVIPDAEDPEYTLVVATTGTAEPYTYYKGTELTGYDIELARRFALWLGADLEFKVYDWGGIISAAQGGDADCIFQISIISRNMRNQ